MPNFLKTNVSTNSFKGISETYSAINYKNTIDKSLYIELVPTGYCNSQLYNQSINYSLEISFI